LLHLLLEKKFPIFWEVMKQVKEQKKYLRKQRKSKKKFLKNIEFLKL